MSTPLSRRTAIVATGLIVVQAARAQDPAAFVAPTGTLRIGVYRGSPTFMVTTSRSKEAHGVSFDLGHALARRLGVPPRVVEFPRIADVVEAIARGDVDFMVTNASPARARTLHVGAQAHPRLASRLARPRCGVSVAWQATCPVARPLPNMAKAL